MRRNRLDAFSTSILAHDEFKITHLHLGLYTLRYRSALQLEELSSCEVDATFVLPELQSASPVQHDLFSSATRQRPNALHPHSTSAKATSQWKLLKVSS